MITPYSNKEQLYEIIEKITNKYYSKSVENIIFLEEYNNTNYVGFMEQLRDAYSHLAKIFCCSDILSREGQSFVFEHLAKYKGHLQRILNDTYIKIISIYRKYLESILGDKYIVDVQLAQKIADVRSDKVSGDDKFALCEEIIEYLEKSINKHVTRI